MASSTTTGRGRVGRPTLSESNRLGESLRSAALDVFLERGFDGATMEAIAQAAGVTKRTLYGRYPDKRTLFVAVVSWATAHWEDEIPDGVSDDLATGLHAIGRATLARAMDPDLSRLNRMVLSETTRFPEFADKTRSLTWSPRMRALMALLEHHTHRGALEIDDIEMAAEQFLGLVLAIPERLAAFGISRPEEDERRRLDQAVKLFMFGTIPR
jgi:AcrR family transcriptional regulator